MSGDKNRAAGLVGALVERLKAIPDGQVSATARAGNITLRQLLKLRKGDNPDIRLSTLERLARGLGLRPSELVAELEAGGDYEVALDGPSVAPKTARAVRTVLRRARDLAEAVERLAADMPQDDG